MVVVRFASVTMMVLFFLVCGETARKCSITLKPLPRKSDACTRHCERRYGWVELAPQQWDSITKGMCFFSTCWCLVNKRLKLSMSERVKLWGSSAIGFKKWYIEKIKRRRNSSVGGPVAGGGSGRGTGQDVDGRMVDTSELPVPDPVHVMPKQKEQGEDSTESTASNSSKSSKSSKSSRTRSPAKKLETPVPAGQITTKPPEAADRQVERKEYDTESQHSEKPQRSESSNQPEILGEVPQGCRSGRGPAAHQVCDQKCQVKHGNVDIEDKSSGQVTTHPISSGRCVGRSFIRRCICFVHKDFHAYLKWYDRAWFFIHSKSVVKKLKAAYSKAEENIVEG